MGAPKPKYTLSALTRATENAWSKSAWPQVTVNEVKTKTPRPFNQTRFTGRKEINAWRQVHSGYKHLKAIHAALERKAVGSTFVLKLTSKSGTVRAFTYEKTSPGVYVQIRRGIAKSNETK